MDAKREFVALARAPDANIRALCRRFAISPPTGYALLRRYAEEGEGAFRPALVGRTLAAAHAA